MKTKPFIPQVLASSLLALLVFAVGFYLLAFDSRLSRVLTRASYDWSFGLTHFAQPDLKGSDVVIIYIDEESLRELNQPLNAPMDRSLHARLLRQLKADGARAVAMDIVFSDPGPEAADADMAEAMRSNGHVAIAADLNQSEVINDYAVKKLTRLYPPFVQAAARTGLDLLSADDDFLARRHFHFLPGIPDAPPSLSWTIAQMLNLKPTRDAAGQTAERWVNYYGPEETVPHISYKYALDDERKGYFRNKIVFIGARPKTTSLIERRDELRNPYPARSGYKSVMPAVEVHATQFLNLERGDWLVRPSSGLEVAIMALAAFIFCFGLLRFRPLIATGLAIAGVLTVMLIAQSLFVIQHIWFAWLIIVCVQIPCALLSAIIFRSLEWISQRRKLEEQRRRDDLRIREQAALLDKAQDAIIVHDLNWRPLYWNKSAEQLYGWSFEETKDKNIRKEIFAAEDAKMLEAFQQALSKGEWSGELKHTSRKGKSLTIQSRWTLVRDDQGHPKSVFVISTDVTDQKQLEAQFLRTQRMESIGTLASGIAHDLNNVLSPILMGVELLKMKVPDERGQKTLNTMASSARRGADMVKQVLAFGRGQEGERTLVQLKHLIREMQKITRETFPKTIEVQVEVENTKPILGDATQMHQILLNLCVNARDAMPDGGSILISAKDVTLSQAGAAKFVGAKAANYVLLSVADSGTGIPPEIIHKIFEPFFTTKEIGKGTGLGLSTVMTIIKTHGGFLDLQSQMGKGTTFNVYLPSAETAVPVAEAGGPTKELWGKGEIVMVVDDEPAVLELTSTLLGHYGYKVITANHGADAVALHAQYQEKVNVVLMDMMMPVMDGPTAIRALKKQQPSLPVLAISGLMQSDKLKERLGEYEVPFLPKPYTTEKLLENLRRLVAPIPLVPAIPIPIVREPAGSFPA